MNQAPKRIVRSATVFVEAFGRRSTTSDANGLINSEEEDLYSVFRARSELMSWYGADRATQRPIAWHMHEAAITADADKPGPGTLRIAYAQVGLEPHPAEIVLRLPALIQCFHDAVRRFGDVDLSSSPGNSHFNHPRPAQLPDGPYILAQLVQHHRQRPGERHRRLRSGSSWLPRRNQTLLQAPGRRGPSIHFRATDQHVRIAPYLRARRGTLPRTRTTLPHGTTGDPARMDA